MDSAASPGTSKIRNERVKGKRSFYPLRKDRLKTKTTKMRTGWLRSDLSDDTAGTEGDAIVRGKFHDLLRAQNLSTSPSPRSSS